MLRLYFTLRDHNIKIANKLMEIHEFCKIIQGDNVALLIKGKTIIASVTKFFRNNRYKIQLFLHYIDDTVKQERPSCDWIGDDENPISRNPSGCDNSYKIEKQMIGT